MKRWLPLLILVLPAAAAAQQTGLPAMSVVAGADGTQEYTVSLQILAVMTALTLLPAALLGMTAFTRIMIVLAILRQALGTGQTPSNQVLLSAGLFLTLFIMQPVFQTSYDQAIGPYMNGDMKFQEAAETAFKPFREFMLSQTREDDIALFVDIGGIGAVESPDDLPISVLMSSFLTSELKTAFQIGFLLFIPFVVIDLVVASVLMSMGMMMLSPMIISLPFKVMLFVLIDGWALIMGSLAASFLG